MESNTPPGVIESAKNSIKQYLTFNIGNEQFGVDVKHVREVIEPEEITRVPLVKEVLLGVINLRGIIVPVFDLTRRFFNRKCSITKKSRIIIYEIENDKEKILIGMMIDFINNVISIAAESIQGSPEFGTGLRTDFLSGITKIGEQYILLLNINTVLNINELSIIAEMRFDYKKFLSTGRTEDEGIHRDDIIKDQKQKEDIRKESFVIFNIRSFLYAIGMKKLKEVIKIKEYTQIPNAMPFMKGVVDLRGTMVPLVDMRLRCNLEERRYDDETVVLIVELKKDIIGLIIDSIVNVIELPLDSIQDTVHYTVEIQKDFIAGMSKINDRVVIFLNIEKILTDEELEQYKEDGIINKPNDKSITD